MKWIRLSGVTFEGRQQVISRLTGRDSITLKRRPNNIHDPNAIEVVIESGKSIGWIPRELSGTLASEIDRGILFDARIVKKVGGNGYPYGVIIHVAKLTDKLEVLKKINRLEYNTNLKSRLKDQFNSNHRLSYQDKETIQKLVRKAYNNLVSSGEPSFEPLDKYNLLFLIFVNANSFRVSITSLSDCKYSNNELTELSNSPYYVGDFNIQSGYQNVFNTDESNFNIKEVIDFFHVVLLDIFEQLAVYLLEQLEARF